MNANRTEGGTTGNGTNGFASQDRALLMQSVEGSGSEQREGSRGSNREDDGTVRGTKVAELTEHDETVDPSSTTEEATDVERDDSKDTTCWLEQEVVVPQSAVALSKRWSTCLEDCHKRNGSLSSNELLESRTPFLDNLFKCLDESDDSPYWTILHLLASSTEYNVDVTDGVMARLINGFQHYVSTCPRINQPRSTDIKIAAFLIAFRQKHKMISNLMEIVFDLAENAEIFVPLVKKDIETKRYDVAFIVITRFKLQSHFTSMEEILPLFLRDKFDNVEEYVDGDMALLQRLVGFFDTFCVPKSQAEPLMKALNIPDDQEKLLKSRFLIGVIMKFVEKFNIDRECWRNARFMRRSNALFSTLHMKYVKGIIQDEAFDLFVKQFVGQSRVFQTKLVFGMAKFNDVSGAAHYAVKYRVPLNRMPESVKIVLQGGREHGGKSGCHGTTQGLPETVGGVERGTKAEGREEVQEAERGERGTEQRGRERERWSPKSGAVERRAPRREQGGRRADRRLPQTEQEGSETARRGRQTDQGGSRPERRRTEGEPGSDRRGTEGETGSDRRGTEGETGSDRRGAHKELRSWRRTEQGLETDRRAPRTERGEQETDRTESKTDRRESGSDVAGRQEGEEQRRDPRQRKRAHRTSEQCWLEYSVSVPADTIKTTIDWLHVLERSFKFDSYRKFRDILNGILTKVDSVYWTILHLVASSADYSQAVMERDSLTSFLVRAFLDHMENETKPASEPSDDQRRAAFLVAFHQSHKTVFLTLANIFNLSSNSEIYLPLIRQEIKMKFYDIAARAAVLLKVQTHFTPEEILFPLFLQRRFDVVFDYVEDDISQQQQFVAFLDQFCIKEQSLEYQALIRNFTPSVKQKAALLPDAMTRAVKRYVKEFDVPREHWPNVARRDNHQALCFILKKKYEMNLMNDEDFNDFVMETVHDSPELQLKLVSNMDEYKDVNGAAYFAVKYQVALDLVGPRVKIAIEKGKYDDRTPIKYPPFEKVLSHLSDPVSVGLQRYMPTEVKTILVYEPEDFETAMENISKAETGGVVAIDCEWKPVFNFGTSPRLSLLQVATKDQIFIIDILHMESRLSDGHWSGFNHLLSNESIRKLGYTFDKNFAVLAKTSSVVTYAKEAMKNFIKMSNLCNNVLKKRPDLFPYYEGTPPRHRHLDLFIRLCLNGTLDMMQQQSNWERRPLNPYQIIYAGIDAYCLIDIYRTLLKSSLELGLDLLSFCKNKPTNDDN